MPDAEKITSPEQLNEYIRVTSPGAWIILSSILVFLAGLFIWIFTGRLEVSFSSYVYTDGKNSYAFLPIEQASKLKNGTAVRLSENGTSGTVVNVSEKSLSFSDISQLIGESSTLAMNINDRTRFMKADLQFTNPPAKISGAVFILDKVNPVSFLLK
ncbi:MAG: hypothetical protein IKN30_01710 [Synergistaceae bacterium]|nr:hypothetical protein [Synergistaceae bacterium]